MDDQIKKNLKKAVQQAEISVARSILRRKYQKDGKPPPHNHQLEKDSRQVAAQAHEIIAKRSKNVWKELKKLYPKSHMKK